MIKPDILIYQHNYYKPLLDKAIKLTEQYVSNNKLILTGGMAIDMALRMHNNAIYGDDELPDYDIISDQNLYHAHALAQILCNAGLSDINVINAVHILCVHSWNNHMQTGSSDNRLLCSLTLLQQWDCS